MNAGSGNVIGSVHEIPHSERALKETGRQGTEGDRESPLRGWYLMGGLNKVREPGIGPGEEHVRTASSQVGA